MTRIKICGITREEDAAAAVETGADAIGVVFARSPRRSTVAQARRIVATLPPYISAVGVFVNARASTILRTVAEAGLSEVQLHGDETPDFVQKLGGLRITKALRVRDRTFIDRVRQFCDVGVQAILLDAYSPAARGGTSKRLDWNLVTGALGSGLLDDTPPLILAGGLTPLNVRAGVRRIRPWGVDVSSGVETEPGIKCPEKMARFIAAVNA